MREPVSDMAFFDNRNLFRISRTLLPFQTPVSVSASKVSSAFSVARDYKGRLCVAMSDCTSTVIEITSKVCHPVHVSFTTCITNLLNTHLRLPVFFSTHKNETQQSL